MTAIEEISQKIGIGSSYLENLVQNSDKLYKAYYLPKSASRVREIEAPSKPLKAIQRWILRNILEPIPVSERARGFVRHRGIESNARYHLGKKNLFTIDIKDFFPSINADAVNDVFLNSKQNADYSTVYSELCTFRDRLPQGAPTSPALSNIVFVPVDNAITELCSRNNVPYSRYADDMTFSSNDLQLLKDIYPQIERIITSAGYTLNTDKTRFLTGKGRMSVTGLILNSGRITTGRDRKRLIRRLLYRHIVYDDPSVDVNHLFGTIAFVRGIEPDYYKRLRQYAIKLTENKHKT